MDFGELADVEFADDICSLAKCLENIVVRLSELCGSVAEWLGRWTCDQ